jgi:polyisoprenoid-binding protein YceI
MKGTDMTRFIPLLLAATLATSAYAADTYKIDPAHSMPMFELNHLGFSLQRGRFDKIEGTVTLDRAARKGSVDVTIDTASVDTGWPARDKHVRSEGFFDVEKYPTMTYKSDRFVFRKGMPVAAEGTLTLRGVSKPVRLRITRFHCGINPMVKKPECGAEVSANIKRSDFGMTEFLPAVGNEIHIMIPVEARKE